MAENSNRNAALNDATQDRPPNRVTTGHGSAAGYRDDYYADEISLRDLYLILKNNIQMIVGVPIIVGALAFIGSQFLPPTYEASSTAIVAPPPVTVTDETLLQFNPRVPLNFEAYEDLVFSDQVLEVLLARHRDGTLTLNALRSMFEVEQIGESGSRTTQQDALLVRHRVRASEPELAARLADYWAEASLEGVRNSLLDTLTPVEEVTSAEVEALMEKVRQAEVEWEDFHSTDELALLSRRASSLRDEIANGEVRLDTLQRSLAIAESRRAALQQQLDTELAKITSTNPASDNFLAGLTLDQARSYLQEQLQAAQTRAEETQQALDTFDLQHNLQLMRERITSLTNTITTKERRLDELNGNITIAISRLSRLDELIMVEPDRLMLRDTISGNAVLTEAVRQQGVSDVIGLQLESEALNAVRTALENQRALVQSDLAAMTEEVAVLGDELPQLNTQLTTVRDQVVVRETERSRLALAAQQEQELYATLRSRNSQLANVDLDPRQITRILRDTTPEVLDLQAQLRRMQVEVQALTTERTLVEQQLLEHDDILAIAQRRIASQERQQEELQRTLQNARSAYQRIESLQPTVTYLTNLTATGARLLNRASVPVSPSGTGSMLITALAIVLAGMVTVLFVFLREAVRAPSGTREDEFGTVQSPKAGSLQQQA